MYEYGENMNDALEGLAILPPCEGDIEILQRDDSFLMINKPTRILSVPGRHPLNRDSVIARLQKEYPNASIVHRLDFDTSGLMVVPLTKAALSNISKQFQARTVRKTYTAVVDGLVKNDSGVIDSPIAADEENRPKYKVSDDGKKSITEFSVVSRDESANTTRVLLHPVTGRSHQLRLHMQAIGHSILGCEFYASDTVKKKADRLLLHATELEFSHPLNNKLVFLTCTPSF